MVPWPDVDAWRRVISTDGGRNPQWSSAGSELFFVDRQGRMIAAQIEANPEFLVTVRNTLFTLPPELLVPVDAGDDFCDVVLDDQAAFLMARPAGKALGGDRAGFVVVQNFFEELGQVVPER